MAILSEKHPVARKRHQCFGCNASIEVGQKYYYYFWAGGYDTGPAKLCLTCGRVLKEVWPLVTDPDDTYGEGDLAELHSQLQRADGLPEASHD